jgi:hypothetical protein
MFFILEVDVSLRAVMGKDEKHPMTPQKKRFCKLNPLKQENA